MTTALLNCVEPVLRGEVESNAITNIPYAVFLGLEAFRLPNEEIAVRMPFKDALIGSPSPPRLHGGTVGALLEFAGTMSVALAAREAASAPLESIPKTIGITIEYMRGGATQDIYASAQVLRLGRRVANVRATAWQDSFEKPNATASMHFLMP
ncbi:MAG: PaaI family thioesterase [Pseudomonadota bacterium]